MKVIFVTTIAVFHQIPIWDSFVSGGNVDFTYLSTGDLSQERINMGYKEEQRYYIIKSKNLSEHDLNKLFSNVDFVIVGSNKDKRLIKYIRKCKQIFFSCEHIKRKNDIHSFLSILRFFGCIYLRYLRSRKYLLAYSFYAGKEFNHFGFSKNNIFAFGYFPRLSLYSQFNSKDPFLILWTGRFVSVKRPVLALKALSYFLKIDSRYHLMMIGNGPLSSKIKKYINKNKLNDRVILSDFIAHDLLVETMNKSGVFLFTSNKGEGWGAVLNEALSTGCVAFASDLAGSTRFLIEDSINGFTFHSKRDLFTKIKSYSELSIYQQNTIREEAVKSIGLKWNCDIAGQRLFALFQSFIKNEKLSYNSGPISKYLLTKY